MPVKTGIQAVGSGVGLRKWIPGLRRYDEVNDLHSVEKVIGRELLR